MKTIAIDTNTAYTGRGKWGGKFGNLLQTVAGIATLLAFASPAFAYNVTISTGATSSATYSAGTYTATGDSAVINASELEGYLATTDVIIDTTSNGSESGNITVDTALSWSDSTTLTLTAYHGIDINADITVAGGGGVVLTTNNGGSGGDYAFNDGASLSFTGGSAAGATLTIDAEVYTLLYSMSDLQNVGMAAGRRYALATSLDASATATWTPIGTSTGTQMVNGGFKGVLEGLGHTVSNLVLTDANLTGFGGYAGLFGVSGGTVRDIGVVGGSITCTNCGAAPLMVANVGGTLEHVWADTPVSVTVDSSATANNTFAAGGLVGGTAFSDSGNPITPPVVFDAHASGTVTVTGSVTAGNITVKAGGLGGRNVNSIKKCHATGAVSVSVSGATAYVGGLLGVSVQAATDEPIAINKNNYATGSVYLSADMAGYVGGLIGYVFNSDLSKNYSTGSVISVNTGTATNIVGGFVGQYQDDVTGITITDNYWDTETSGQSTSGTLVSISTDTLATGMTTAELQGSLPTGFTSNPWATGTGLYPYLNSQYSSTPQAIAGTVYSDLGVTALGSDASGAVTVSMVADGTEADSATVGANGYYYLLAPADSQDVLVYLDGASSQGNAYVQSPATGQTSVDIWGDTVWLASGETTVSPILTGLAGAIGSISNSDILYDGDFTANAAIQSSNSGGLDIDTALDRSGYALILDGAGPVTQSAAITADSLALLGSSGSYTLTDATNSVTTLAADTGALSFANSGDLTVGTIGADAGVAGSGAVTLSTSGNLTIASGATVSGGSDAEVVLAADGNFVNNQGSDAVTVSGSGRWLIYSSAPGTDTFASLDSANTPIWNATYATLPPASVSLSGNRYLFAEQPSLTVTTTDVSKTYGDDATSAVATAFSLSGLQTGVSGAYDADTATSTLSGSATSSGSSASAGGADSPYTIVGDGLSPINGYSVSYLNNGLLTVNQADQSISGFAGSPSSGSYGSTATLSASASSGNAVTYGSSTTSICTVSGDTVSFIGVGTCTVTADQAGDGNYNAAPQVSLDITVSATLGITMAGSGSGSVTADSGTIVWSGSIGAATYTGGTVTLTATADNDSLFVGWTGDCDSSGQVTMDADKACTATFDPDTTAPTVSAANISISGASGTGGAYIIGDTVTASWDNTASGDNNGDINTVTVDFSQFGGGTVSASNSAETWSASYTLISGSIEGTGKNVAITATDYAANSTTTADTTGATVDNVAPGTPTVSGYTPTNDATPTWSWSSGGGGNGSYRYDLDSAGWVTTTATAYTPASDLANGDYSLAVQEQDASGNWSASGSLTIQIDTSLVEPVLTTPATSNVSAAMVTLTLQSDTTGTGYFTLLSGSGTACGTGLQVSNGEDSSGAAAYRIGSLALTADTPSSYTVRNLAESSDYTVCFTALGDVVQTTPVTVNVTTSAGAAPSPAAWATEGSAGFSASNANDTSLAIGPAGTPYVAYSDTANSDKATVMKYDGSAWTTVGSAGFSAGGAYYTLLAFAPDGTPYVAYQDATNSSKTTVMEYDGSAWVTVGSAGFSAGAAYTLSFAFAPDSTPYLAYMDSGNGARATVMKYDGSAWVTVGSAGFSAGIAANTSLTFGPDGTPYVAYKDGGNSSKATVMQYDGSAWVSVGSAGFSVGAVSYVSLAFAPDGTPYVAYEDYGTSNKATVMLYSGGTWSVVGSAGFSASDAGYTSLSFAPDGTPYVAFEDGAYTGKATVMKYDGSSWLTVGSGGFSAGNAQYVSFAFGPDGTPYVAYEDDGNSYKATVMKYAQTYSVTYDGNGSEGGTVPTDNGLYVEGETVTVADNSGALVRASYRLNGWNTATDGSGTSYAADGSATFAMGSADVTLYAEWSAKYDQTITFNALADKIYGDADFSISASSDSGLSISFSSTTTSVCTVSGSTVSLVVAGTCSITASQAGDGNYNAAADVSRSFTVQGDGDSDGIADGSDNCPAAANADQLDTDGDGEGDACDSDDDNDGVDDASDAFPLDDSEWQDSDSDGTGDNADTDDDNDGVADSEDAFPLDPTETVDSDGDGVGDNGDAFPNDATETVDTDSDGIGDNTDTDDDDDGIPDRYETLRGLDPLDAYDADYDLDADGYSNIIEYRFGSELNDYDSVPDYSLLDSDSDGDTVSDVADTFSVDVSEFIDTDGDGTGDSADMDDDDDGLIDSLDEMPLDANESLDSDGDGVGDNSDAFPNDATETVDTDSDGTGNNADTDDDNDGYDDDVDAFPLDATEWLDSDGDGYGDNSDAFPYDATEWLDSDGDGLGDNADIDADGDGWDDNQDAFPTDPVEWLDSDSDGVGDNSDAFPLDDSEWLDTDGDSIGNNADTDDDNDGVADEEDTFPLDPAETLDTDSDGIGNNADTDDDNDTVEDTLDNCPLTANAEQLDSDGDGVGDACDSAISGSKTGGGGGTGWGWLLLLAVAVLRRYLKLM